MLTDARLSKPQQPYWLAMLPPVLLAVALMTGAVKWIEWRPSFLEPSQNAVYRIRDGAWQKLPELPGDPEKLQVSPGGAVWTLYWHRSMGTELARLEGVSWHIYRAADFGAKDASLSSFVLDGEDAWADTDAGVAHWDGHRWKLYPETISKDDPTSIAAAQGQVWTLGEKGSLAHFDGSRWSMEQVTLPGAKWDDDAQTPELVRTADGSLWIVRGGVWRWDGARWAAVERDGHEFQNTALVGTTAQSLWLWDADDVVSMAAGVLKKFAPQEIGFLPGEGIEDVIESGGRILMATTRGLLEFDGSAWRRLPAPGNGVQGVVGIRAGAAGEWFAIGNTPHPLARRWQVVIRSVPLILMLGVLGVVVWMVRISKRRRLDEHQRLQEAVVHATGAVPEEFARDERLLAKQSSWWSASLTTGVIIGAMVGYTIARVFWPRVPSWMFLVIALGLHVLATAAQTLVKRTPKPWDPIEPGGPSFDWGPTRRALPASLAVFVLMNLGSFPVVWLLIAIAALMWYRVLEQKFVLWAIRRGDYSEAMKVIRVFRFYNPEGGATQMRLGQLLLMSGRFREAEEVLRRAVARLRSKAYQAYALESLGDALMEQGRADEARRSFEAALRASPGFRRPYRGMAELVLRQGHDPAKALEYVEGIVGPAGPSWNRWTMNGHSADDYWALKAWALAELGRGAEADAAAAEAIRKTNAKSRPDLAATCRRLGLAMQALDRQAEAEEYLEKAIAADPTGRWAGLAKAALGRKSVWSA